MTEVGNNSNGYHPAVREVAAEISATLHERDELRVANRALENDLAIAHGMNKHYQEELARITKERDYYFRKSFAYTNTLSACRNQIENMMNMVDHETEHPGPVIPVETMQQLENKITERENGGGWTKPAGVE